MNATHEAMTDATRRDERRRQAAILDACGRKSLALDTACSPEDVLRHEVHEANRRRNRAIRAANDERHRAITAALDRYGAARKESRE